MNRFSARRTHESGSSETRHSKTEDPTTPAPAELIPDEVRRQRRRECGTERQRQAHPPGSGERADAKKDGHGGDRKTDLLRQHEGEEHHVAILQQDLDGIAHRTRRVVSVVQRPRHPFGFRRCRLASADRLPFDVSRIALIRPSGCEARSITPSRSRRLRLRISVASDAVSARGAADFLRSSPCFLLGSSHLRRADAPLARHLVPEADHRLGPIMLVPQAVPSRKYLPAPGLSPSQRAANTRRKCPLEKSSTSPPIARTRRITRSARAPTWSGDSPSGQPSRNNCQSGRSARMSALVRPSYAP